MLRTKLTVKGIRGGTFLHDHYLSYWYVFTLAKLYNFQDSPLDFWNRIQNAKQMVDSIGKAIFLFSQCYEPLDALNRNQFVSKSWNKTLLTGIHRLCDYYHGFLAVTPTDNINRIVGYTYDQFIEKITELGSDRKSKPFSGFQVRENKMEIKKVQIADIKVGERFRDVDASKVKEIAKSVKSLGQINPITLDTDLNLISGNHRLESVKYYGGTEIYANILDADEQTKKLVEIDENLVRSDLSILQVAEHISEKEKILTSLGERAIKGENQYKSGGVNYDTTKIMAEKLGISERKYQRFNQIGRSMSDQVKGLVKGTKLENNLNKLLEISQQPEEKRFDYAQALIEPKAKSQKPIKQMPTVFFEKIDEHGNVQLPKEVLDALTANVKIEIKGNIVEISSLAN